MDSNTPTPCAGSDDWTRDTNWPAGQDKTPEQKAADREAALRAKILCYACPLRTQCLDMAFSFPDNDWHIWGGYTASERIAWRDGKLKFRVPRNNGAQTDPERLGRFLAGESIYDLASEYDLNVETLYAGFHNYIWTLRDQADDSSLTWTVVSETQKSETRNSHQSVRAA